MSEENAVMTTQSRLPMGKPWGDQGITLKSAPTGAEAMRQAALNWEVALRPVYTNIGLKTPKFQKIEDKKAVVRTDTMETLSIVGKKWKPIQNDLAFEFFDSFVERGLCEYDTAGYTNNGERVFIIAKIKADPMEVIKGDTVDSYFVLTNTHSSTAAGAILFTNIRFACTNVLPAMMQSEKKTKIFHMGNQVKGIQNVQNLVDMRRGDFKSTMEQYQFLAGRNANTKAVDQYLNAVLSNAKSASAFYEVEGDRSDEASYSTTKKRIVELFEGGRGTDIQGVKGSWWGLYNAVIEYLDYHKGRELNNRLNAVFYGDSMKKSVKALELALDMSQAA